MVTGTDENPNAEQTDNVNGEHHKGHHKDDKHASGGAASGKDKLTYQSVDFLSSSSDPASSTSFVDDDELDNYIEKGKTDSYYDDENCTEYSSILSSQNNRLRIRKKPQRRKKRPSTHMSRTTSYSSITDSTMSLNIITVQINMDTVNFLGRT